MHFVNYKKWGKTRLFAIAITGCAGSVMATSEEDPNGGPPVQAVVDPAVTAGDVQTKLNTQNFGPVVPRSLREPVSSSVSQQQGVLSGRIVYTSPGHGWQWNTSLNRWNTDRGNNNQIVEDFGNHDQFTYYCYYLFNAGATVVPFRPVGNQTNEVILDNDDAQVTYAGLWSNSGSTQYYGEAGDSVSYRFTVASPTETAVATYTPTIPQPGFYPIYTWVLNSSNRCADQLYRIHHSGGISEVRINHIKVGRGWVYLGTYYLEAGNAAYVEISNQTNLPGTTNVIADAIRFGNGMGDVPGGNGLPSGYPREDEGNRYWVQRMIGQGGDTSVYTGGNVGSPPKMAAYMNNAAAGPITDRVYIGIHSNAGGGTGRGARGLINDNTSSYQRTPNQITLANTFGAELNNDMQAINSLLPANWYSGSSDTYTAKFGEMRNDSINGEMDTTIIETAFHDNVSDALIMRDPNSRKYIARAMLHATIKFFNQVGGGQAAFPPNPPTAPKVISNGNGTVTVSWASPAGDPTGSGAPTGYIVYRSSNGYGFGDPVKVTGSTSLVVSDAPVNEITYFRISSSNNGGESFPSETVAVRPSTSGLSSVLVVNAFDRLDSAMNVRENRPNVGTHDRVKPWKSNNYDYAVQHAKALDAGNYSFDTAANEAINSGMLANYEAVVWAAGEEATADDTFNVTEQTLLQNFLSSGKKVFASGSEIGLDLEAQGGGAAFYNNYLLADYVSDDAATYNLGAGSGIFAGLSGFNFGPATTINDTTYPPTSRAPYDVEAADVINPINGSAQLLAYTTGGGAATAGEVGSGKVITLGFPFEAITNATTRNQIMSASMSYFQVPQSGSSSVSDWTMY